MTAAPIDPPPRPPTPATVAARLHALPPPRELREPVESPAVARDRARWADCSRGAHRWTDTPLGAVCLHCPVMADQAERVRAARRARAVHP